MALGVFTESRLGRGGRRAVALAGALASISCVPMAEQAPSPLRAAATVPTVASVTIPLTWQAAPEAAPAPTPTPIATLLGRTPLDRFRAHDCLAQAIYYEAASESEDGQRAVAQVVLNRVRHPAWPNSVCGVVYQGPMREGGGCQFTFTCDGALARRPAGIAWARARALAAEALAGRVYEPAALSTHYHTHAVSPHWAPALVRTVSIGAHQFYRLPGRWSAAQAFTAAYAGTEPFPRPAMTLVRARAAEPAAFAASFALPLGPAPVGSQAAPPPPEAPLPPSTVREEYRHSGQWRADAPAAITGR